MGFGNIDDNMICAGNGMIRIGENGGRLQSVEEILFYPFKADLAVSTQFSSSFRSSNQYQSFETSFYSWAML